VREGRGLAGKGSRVRIRAVAAPKATGKPFAAVRAPETLGAFVAMPAPKATSTALAAMPAPKNHAITEKAQRFLASAFESVNAVFENLEVLRDVDRQKTGRDPRGRLPHNQEDMLRVAIAFTGAGLDATLKQLVRDALPTLLDKSGDAHEQFRDFVEKHLGDASANVSAKKLSGYLARGDIRGALIDRYVADLTGDSLQSSGQLFKTAKSLGLADAQLRKNKDRLDQFFTARNQIIHELDLQHTAKQGDSSRRPRRLSITRDDCSLVFETGQQFINAVVDLLI
jgi:hypothetical protein